MIARIGELYATLRWRSLALVLICAVMVALVLALSRPIVMYVDGQRVDSDVAPVTTASERAYVPLRSLADALGAETEVLKDGSVEVSLGGQSVVIRAGDRHAKVNGMPLTFRRAPFRVRGRVLVPLDAVARALNVRAKYDSRAARIEVVTPGIGQAP